MNIKIEKGIPIPPIARKASLSWIRDMDIGDSYVIDHDRIIKQNTYAAATAAGAKVTIRTVIKDGVKKFRVWRIA